MLVHLSLSSSTKSINLDPADIYAVGGEAKVWIRDDLAFKVYHNPKSMNWVKAGELQRINDPHVIKPECHILDTKGDAIGIAMKAVKNTVPLLGTHSKSFRQRTGLTQKTIGERVLAMRKTVEAVHAANILIVDLNPCNLLVIGNEPEVWFIDTDSWQTPNYPASAIMDAIRDRLTNKYNEGSDWFSFAVVTHEMFRGTHPYRGTHPKYGISTIEKRMDAQASIFDSGVRTNPSVYPETVIPSNYLDWYKATFVGKKRVPPPKSFQGEVEKVKQGAIVSRSQGLSIREIFSGYGAIRSYTWLNNEHGYVVTDQGIFNIYNPSHAHTLNHNPVFFLSRDGIPFLLDSYGFYNLSSRYPTPRPHDIDSYLAHEGKLYIKTGDSLCLLELRQVPGASRTISFLPTPVTNVMRESCKLSNGCAVSRTLSRWLISILPSGTIYNIPELPKYTRVYAGHSNGITIIYAIDFAGNVRRLVIKDDCGKPLIFDNANNHHTTDINFITLPTGVCIIPGPDYVDVFHHSPKHTTIERISNDIVNSSVVLTQHEGAGAFFTEDKLFSFRKL